MLMKAIKLAIALTFNNMLAGLGFLPSFIRTTLYNLTWQDSWPPVLASFLLYFGYVKMCICILHEAEYI